ncbi:MAG: hypothetical protein ACI9BH_002752, partial [Paracoccaceae bacterium]
KKGRRRDESACPSLQFQASPQNHRDCPFDGRVEGVIEPNNVNCRAKPPIKAPTRPNRTPFGTNHAPGMEKRQRRKSRDTKHAIKCVSTQPRPKAQKTVHCKCRRQRRSQSYSFCSGGSGASNTATTQPTVQSGCAEIQNSCMTDRPFDYNFARPVRAGLFRVKAQSNSSCCTLGRAGVSLPNA